ncbi:NCS2 family permease [uncultured Tyzzerella sp.]|uniref:NCS2 family permease n=1 Tax=uncultured Tyzzerella sp. TaxID=2321398 RepID=UPI002942FD17|nr:NCS2 family permease [uncultured Tyzzerella sp.]
MIKHIKKFLYNKFDIIEHKSNLRTEVLAGVTNYFTLIYLVMLVPEILMNVFTGAISEDGSIIRDFVLSNGLTANEMLVTLTAASFICSGLSSIIMGYLTNLPFIQGPSLAVGTFITYTVCINFGYTYNQALAIVFISGLIFFVLALFGAEKKIHKSIPKNIKYAATCGIGLFITYQGLLKSHIIEQSSINTNLFDISSITSNDTKTAILALIGVILITILHKKHIYGSIFIGKIVCILLAFPLGLVTLKNIDFFTSINLESVLFALDFKGIIDFSSSGLLLKTFTTLIVVLFSICIMDIFETMAMLIVTDNFVEISKERVTNKRIPQILEIDSITTSLGSTIGSVTVSTYVESTAGIMEGGRTGLTAIVTGILFLLSSFLSPLVALVPSAATATTLIIAGVLMMSIIKFIDFENIDEAVPAFFTMILMPLTNSILVGIAFGVISYVVIQLFLGGWKKVNKILYLLSILLLISLIYLPR